MRSPRHKKPTDHDLKELREAHRILCGLMARLSPVSEEYRSVVMAADAVRTTAIDWTQNPEIWRDTANKPLGGGPPPTFLNGPRGE